MFTAFFDTCVLYPIVKTDLALRCAQQGMFAIRWSDQVLEELTRVLQDPPASLKRAKAERRIQMMNTAFPQAEVSGWEPLESIFDSLPDFNDRHVAAAALHCHADVIVTENLKDFPPEALAEHHLFAQGFDEFMCDLWELKPSHPAQIFHILDAIALKRGIDWRTLVRELKLRHGLKNFADLVYGWHFDNP